MRILCENSLFFLNNINFKQKPNELELPQRFRLQRSTIFVLRPIELRYWLPLLFTIKILVPLTFSNRSRRRQWGKN